MNGQGILPQRRPHSPPSMVDLQKFPVRVPHNCNGQQHLRPRSHPPFRPSPLRESIRAGDTFEILIPLNFAVESIFQFDEEQLVNIQSQIDWNSENEDEEKIKVGKSRLFNRIGFEKGVYDHTDYIGSDDDDVEIEIDKEEEMIVVVDFDERGGRSVEITLPNWNNLIVEK